MRNCKGFTLLELVIVIGILGILLAAAYPNIVAYRERALENERVNHEKVINKALRQYYAFTGMYPNQADINEFERDDPITETERVTLMDEILAKTRVKMDDTIFDYEYLYIESSAKYCIDTITAGYK